VNEMLLLQVISYTDIMCLEDQEEEGRENGNVTGKNTSQNSASAELLSEHNMVDVDSVPLVNVGCGGAQPLNVDNRSSYDRKFQLSFEDMFPKSGSTGGIPLLRESNSAANTDVDATDGCDVFVSGCDDAQTDGPNTEFTSLAYSPSESLSVSVQSDVEAKESAITRNVTHRTLSDSVTLTDKLKNVSVLCRTSELSQCDISVTDSTDAERSFSRESSLAVERVYKADDSMKDNLDSSEKVDQVEVSSKDSAGLQVSSYDQAHQKCGLILCDFPTVSNSVLKRI
jgi:hypothetical protein